MDSITQIALGAAIGQAIGYKKFGPKAMVLGGFAGCLPDFDILHVALSPDEFAPWLYHRHFTHSLWFGPVIGPLMGWGIWRHYGRQAGHLAPWIWIMVLALFTHPLLDLFTVYGTQLFAPFSDQRFTVSGVCIIDPIYTCTLFAAMGFAYFKKWRSLAQPAAWVALALTTAYLFYGAALNSKAEDLARAQLADQHIKAQRVEAFTTIFQPFLRRILVEDEGGAVHRAGFISTFSPEKIYWTCRKQVDADIRTAILSTRAGNVFNWFSSSTLSMETTPDGHSVLVRDSRYGTPGPSVFGWWAMRFDIAHDENGHVSATYKGRESSPRDASLHAIGGLFRAAYGVPNDFLLQKDEGCPHSFSETSPR